MHLFASAKLIILSVILSASTANAQINTEDEANALLRALAGTWEVFDGDSVKGELKSFGETTRHFQDGVLFETSMDSYEKGFYEFYKEGGYIRFVSVRLHRKPTKVSTCVFKCIWDRNSKVLHIHYPKADEEGEGFVPVPTFSMAIGENEVKVLGASGKPNGTIWKRRKAED